MFLFGIKFIQTLWGGFLLMKIAAQNSCYIFYFLLENRIKIFWDVLYLEVIVNSNSWEIIPFWRVSRSVYFSLKLLIDCISEKLDLFLRFSLYPLFTGTHFFWCYILGTFFCGLSDKDKNCMAIMAHICFKVVSKN